MLRALVLFFAESGSDEEGEESEIEGVAELESDQSDDEYATEPAQSRTLNDEVTPCEGDDSPFLHSDSEYRFYSVGDICDLFKAEKTMRSLVYINGRRFIRKCL